MQKKWITSLLGQIQDKRKHYRNPQYESRRLIFTQKEFFAFRFTVRNCRRQSQSQNYKFNNTGDDDDGQFVAVELK